MHPLEKNDIIGTLGEVLAILPKKEGEENMKRQNTPFLQTDRLILRKFAEEDMEAMLTIFQDEEVNTFLPWYPVKTLEETRALYEDRFQKVYRQPWGYQYAICLKSDNMPIGYVDMSTDDSCDLGYGLRKEFWHRGIVTEAARAVVEQLKRDEIPYITATHDVNNPRSGGVMKQLGMKYQYTNEEHCMPKDIVVTFRMYQLNLDGNEERVYKKYWEQSRIHYIEEDI